MAELKQLNRRSDFLSPDVGRWPAAFPAETKMRLPLVQGIDVGRAEPAKRIFWAEAPSVH